ncbi:MAG: alpha/beta fold hydrolase [Chloroflexi bacterium]|nr:alpha/beta fold hydrolase [Chloroflexota bacterium]
MTQHSHLDPSPFFLEGGPVGVLLIHGFTGSPPEMRPLGDYLHQRGYTVSGPLLPGHGTTVEDMNRRKWTEWTGHAEQSLADLQARCETVFVGGLSMGALLTLYLAAHHPELPGAITYSPAVVVANRLIYLAPALKHLLPTRSQSGESDLTDPEADLRLWSYEQDPVFAAHELLKLIRQVRRLLPQVTCPLLVIHSTLDTAIHPTSAQFTYDRVGSTDKELVTLRNSGHCITVDSEWESVAAKTYEFIQARQ